MADKITMQDIADATGYSRNTVSKVLNGHRTVPDATRKFILTKATEIGYKGYNDTGSISKTVIRAGTIALFTYHMPDNSHYGSSYISNFTKEIARQGYSLTAHPISPEDIAAMRLPGNFNPKSVDGIACITLFDKEYSYFLCRLGLPMVFADSFANPTYTSLSGDLVMMENVHCLDIIFSNMLENGAKTFGFAGNNSFCQSFYERHLGFATALMNAGIPYEEKYNITEHNTPCFSDSNWVMQRVYAMKELPDAFICATDQIAISIMDSLKALGKRVPQDIMIAGFDDAPGSDIVEPSLTTVRVLGGEMGKVAAKILIDRIAHPNAPTKHVYITSEVIFRDSAPLSK